MIPITYGDYHAIAIPMQYSVFHRYIYVKKHVVKQPESDTIDTIETETSLIPERTIFAVNLPHKVSNSPENWFYKAINQAVGSIQYIVPNINGEKNEIQTIDERFNLMEHNTSAYIVFKSKQACTKLFTIKVLEHIDYPHELHGLKRTLMYLYCILCISPHSLLTIRYYYRLYGRI